MSRSKQELKPGWRWVKFGDVVKLSRERSQDPLSDGYERFVALEHIDREDLRIRRWGNVADGTTFTSVFRPGQVLFGKRRAYQRKVAVADFAGVCSGDIYVLESKDPQVLLPELLPFICQTKAFFEHAVGTSAGSLSPRTSWASLTEFDFALPSPEEQLRIAGLLQPTEQTNAELNNALESAELLRKATLIEIFDSLCSTGFNEQPWLGLGSACQFVRMDEVGSVLMGRQLSPKHRMGKGSRLYLRVANVFDGYIDTSDVLEMDFTDSEFIRYRLQPGDVLLNEGQSRELVGRSAIFRNDIPDCCFQNTLIRFRPIKSVLPEYAHSYFQYCQYTGKFARISKQTTSVAHLGVQRFAEMKFPMLEVQAQKKIVDLISGITNAVTALESRASQIKDTKEGIMREVWG